MVAIRSIETAVPPTVIAQSQFRDLLAAQPGYGRLGKRLVTAAFDASAIETRHVVLEEFAVGASAADPAFYDAETGIIQDPGTRLRNDTYVAHSKPLIVEAGRNALRSSGLEPGDVTHVVTVSCTGFYAPGPDYVLVRELGLAPSTQRYHLGFLGCYGAFPALRMAKQFCQADPEAVVLVVCVELCSLHVHVDDDPDTIVAASVFADGASAAVVTDRPAGPGEPVLDLDLFETIIVPEGEGDMAWTIGDHGFDMTLSTYVPRIVEHNVRAALAPLLRRDASLVGSQPRDIARWAIHPGGRSILDRVEETLGLSPEQLAPSRQVLRDYGNMSSATVLFVLRTLLHSVDPARVRELTAAGARDGTATSDDGAFADGAASSAAVAMSDGPSRVCALAFGPGLTVESALMTLRIAS